MDYLIEEATPADLDRIVEIWREGQTELNPLPPVSDSAVRSFYQAQLTGYPAPRIWLAKSRNDKRHVVGWQALLACYPSPSFIECWAQASTYCAKDHRSVRLGTLLLTHAMRQARKLGLLYVSGYVASPNLPSIRLVEACGWSRVGEVRGVGGAPPQLHYIYYVEPDAPARE